MTKYKLVQGHTPDVLERNVNFFLENFDGFAAPIGPPQMFGHSEYIQALELQTRGKS